MSAYIATFHTHLGALRFHRTLIAAGDASAVMAPVPRKLSASCGTCVRFDLPFRPEWADEDLDCIYEQDAEGYGPVFLNKE